MNTLPRFFTLALIVSLPFGLTGCGGDSHEAVLKDTAGLMNEVATILESAKDKASAEAAAKKIKAITPQFEEISKRAKALGEPSPEDALKLMESLASFAPAAMKMQTAMSNIASNPEVAEALSGAMEAFGKAAESAGSFGGK